MIIWVFVVFMTLAVVLTIFGFVADIPLFSFVGTIMIFLLGIGLLNDGLQYKVGENITINTADNVTVQEVVDVYETYDDAGTNRFGWFLLSLGMLAFVLTLYSL